jgi:NADH:ubiquinone oxidoreductase subunit E
LYSVATKYQDSIDDIQSFKELQMWEDQTVKAKSNFDSRWSNEQEFTAEELSKVDAIIERYRSKPGALIPVLEDVQDTLGYLPASIQKKIALGLGVSFSEVYGVVTFYSFFTMIPRGRHTLRCCLGTACYVKGGKKNLEKLSETLGVQPGGTTADRRFSLETVRCLGACGLAPVVMADEDTFRQVKPAELAGLLEDYD